MFTINYNETVCIKNTYIDPRIKLTCHKETNKADASQSKLDQQRGNVLLLNWVQHYCSLVAWDFRNNEELVERKFFFAFENERLATGFKNEFKKAQVENAQMQGIPFFGENNE